MTAILQTPISEKKKRTRHVPEYLIYEWLDGKPIYYRGYKNVLSGKLKPEDIMGSSGLQSLLLSLVEDFIKTSFNKKFWVLGNELGLHIELNNNFNADIAAYDRATHSAAAIAQKNYLNTPPTIVVEVDIKADIKEPLELYCFKKTQALLNWGVVQVVWIFSDQKKIITAKKGEPWLTVDWSETIQMLEKPFNLTEFAAADGVNLNNILDLNKL